MSFFVSAKVQLCLSMGSWIVGINKYFTFAFHYIDKFKFSAACSNSCMERAPRAFTYVSSTGTARASSQGWSYLLVHFLNFEQGHIHIYIYICKEWHIFTLFKNVMCKWHSFHNFYEHRYPFLRSRGRLPSSMCCWTMPSKLHSLCNPITKSSFGGATWQVTKDSILQNFTR